MVAKIKSEVSRKRRRSSESIKPARKSGRTVILKPMGPHCTVHPECQLVPQEVRDNVRLQIELSNDKQLKEYVKDSVVVEKFDEDEDEDVILKPYTRQHSNEYHLKWRDVDFTVCRTLYVSTIGITPWTVRNWLGENRKYLKATTKTEEEKIEEDKENDLEVASEQPPPKKRRTFKVKVPTLKMNLGSHRNSKI